jgi:CRP/FNR family transcriptional regulator, cyclic AMP receptor protein
MTTDTQASKAFPSSVRLVKESSTVQIAELILGSRPFQDMESEDVTVLARYLSLYAVDQGAELFHEGDVGDFLGLIVLGAVDLFKNGPADHDVKVATEGAGKLLGEMAMVDGEPRSATARFMQSGQVLILTKESFQRLLKEHPRAAANFLFRLSRLLSQRLRKTTGLLTSYLK